MKLEHTFSVPADMETVWQAVLDPERVAPCMPGATLAEVDGDSFRGSVKVRLGPISLLYKGSGEFLEKDAAARKIVIKASGKDARGNGTASATVTVTLRDDGAATAGTVHTDLSITGRPAQFGRGLISEVGGKILNSFAECLAKKLVPEADPPSVPKLSVVAQERREAAESEAEERREAVATGAAAGAAVGAATKQKAKLALAEEPETEPIDLLAYAGPSVAKRVAPLVAVAFAVVVFLFRRRRKR